MGIAKSENTVSDTHGGGRIRSALARTAGAGVIESAIGGLGDESTISEGVPEMQVMMRIWNLFRIRLMRYLFFLYLIVDYRFFLWRGAKNSQCAYTLANVYILASNITSELSNK